MIGMKRILLALSVAALTLGAGQCPSKVTGGGTLQGSAGNDTIALTADSCGARTRGKFDYLSHNSDVKMHGDVVGVSRCLVSGVDQNGNPITTCPQCQALAGPQFGLGPADNEADVFYQSTNPAFPGRGLAVACISDNGQGHNSSGPDSAYVQV